MQNKHYSHNHFHSGLTDTLETIRAARSIPDDHDVVTHGHLLPYVGYRTNNFYFAKTFDNPKHPVHQSYANADYYLIDFTVNPYPVDKNYLIKKLEALKQDPRYEYQIQSDNRHLFFRKDISVGNN